MILKTVTSICMLVCLIVEVSRLRADEDSAHGPLLAGATLTCTGLVEAEESALDPERRDEARGRFHALLVETPDGDPWKAYLALRFLETDIAANAADARASIPAFSFDGGNQRAMACAVLDKTFAKENRNSYLYVRYLCVLARLHHAASDFSNASETWRRMMEFENKLLNYAPLHSWDIEAVRITRTVRSPASGVVENTRVSLRDTQAFSKQNLMIDALHGYLGAVAEEETSANPQQSLEEVDAAASKMAERYPDSKAMWYVRR